MTDQPTHEAAPMPTSDEFSQLVALANRGEATALTRLRDLLNDHPEIWQKVGDLAAHTEMLLIDAVAGTNKLLSESLRRKVNEMKEQLLGETPTVLERMAIERVVTAWLAVQHIDGIVAKSVGGTLPQGHFQLRQQDLAGKRLLTAIKALTDLRRLLPRSGRDIGKDVVSTLRIFEGEPETTLPATGTT